MFESSVQDPKRTLTNNRESHLQMVNSQNMEQALQVIARGDSWEASCVDPSTGTVTTKLTSAGPKLVDLLLSKYPKLNPYTTSVATVRGQGSQIAVQDDRVVLNMTLTPNRVACRLVVVTPQGKRPALVQKDSSSGALSTVPAGPNRTVPVPLVTVYSKALEQFPDCCFPPTSWYASTAFVAFREMAVYNDAPCGDPRRHEIGKLVGWKEVLCSGGSHVRVNLQGSRCVMPNRQIYYLICFCDQLIGHLML